MNVGPSWVKLSTASAASCVCLSSIFPDRNAFANLVSHGAVWHRCTCKEGGWVRRQRRAHQEHLTRPPNRSVFANLVSHGAVWHRRTCKEGGCKRRQRKAHPERLTRPSNRHALLPTPCAQRLKDSGAELRRATTPNACNERLATKEIWFCKGLDGREKWLLNHWCTWYEPALSAPPIADLLTLIQCAHKLPTALLGAYPGAFP
eukprot:1158689-Pelagomonas_calceolata.AAC.11